MASAIDKLKPVTGSPTTLSVRDNFGFAEKELNELMRATEDQVTAGGTVDALTANFTEDVVLAEGIEIVVLATGANTGAATLDVDSTGAKSIVRKNGAALIAKDIVGNRHRCVFRYDAANTVWVLQNHGVWNDSERLGDVLAASYARSDAADTISAIHTHTARPAFNGGTTGTDSPFTVDSTFVVANLKAATSEDSDKLGAVAAASYARSDAADTISGIHTHTAIPAFNGGVSGSTAPFTVDSTTLVNNLNADLLDGLDQSQFARTDIEEVFNLSVGIGGAIPGGTFDNGNALAVGDSDTGIRQNGDGVLELFANDVLVADVKTTGMTLILNPKATTQAAGDNSTRIASTAYVQGELIFTKSFTSAEQSITSAGLFTLPHSMGITPKIIIFHGKCITADVGYSIGDEIELNGVNNSTATADRHNSVRKDSTNIVVRLSSTGNVFTAAGKNTGDTFSLTDANWNWFVTAYA